MDITILKTQKTFYKVDPLVAGLFIEAGLAERKNPEPLTALQQHELNSASGNTAPPFYTEPRWTIGNTLEGRPLIRRQHYSETLTFSHEHLQAVYDTAAHHGCPQELLKEFKAQAEQYTKKEAQRRMR